MRLMILSSMACALSSSRTVSIFSERSMESGCILTSAFWCFLTDAGSNLSSDFLSPDAFLTADSAAAIMSFLSNEVTVP